MTEIPFPPVFRDWRPDLDSRVSTYGAPTGIVVEMMHDEDTRPGGESLWYGVELTERDACLFAASVLHRAGEKKLARKVLAKLDKNAAKE